MVGETFPQKGRYCVELLPQVLRAHIMRSNDTARLQEGRQLWSCEALHQLSVGPDAISYRRGLGTVPTVKYTAIIDLGPSTLLVTMPWGGGGSSQKRGRGAAAAQSTRSRFGGRSRVGKKLREVAPQAEGAIDGPKRTPLHFGDGHRNLPSYEVDRVVASQIVDGVQRYKVKWVGIPSAGSTWEPEEHFVGEAAQAKLADYQRKQQRKSQVRDSPPPPWQPSDNTINLLARRRDPESFEPFYRGYALVC